nr:MAG TPA: hypothetical protein [Caudoviricetes sp.]
MGARGFRRSFTRAPFSILASNHRITGSLSVFHR